MKTYVEHTNREYRSTIEHPVGKFCLRFMYPHEYLLEKTHGEGYLTSGFPMLASTLIRDGKEIVRAENKVQYYDTLDEALHRILTMLPDWRSGYIVLEVTESGLIER